MLLFSSDVSAARTCFAERGEAETTATLVNVTVVALVRVPHVPHATPTPVRVQVIWVHVVVALVALVTVIEASHAPFPIHVTVVSLKFPALQLATTESLSEVHMTVSIGV